MMNAIANRTAAITASMRASLVGTGNTTRPQLPRAPRFTPARPRDEPAGAADRVISGGTCPMRSGQRGPRDLASGPRGTDEPIGASYLDHDRRRRALPAVNLADRVRQGLSGRGGDAAS